MITINLLPTKKKASRKMTELQQQVILGTLVLILVSMGMWFYSDYLNSKIEKLKRDKASANARIREQDNMLREVRTVEAERKKVSKKIAVIERLKENRTMLVHLLDDVSKALPKRVNITSLSEGGRKVNIAGTAFTNHDVVRFVDNLKATPSMSEVFLLETVQGAIGGIEIYKYKLQFRFKGV